MHEVRFLRLRDIDAGALLMPILVRRVASDVPENAREAELARLALNVRCEGTHSLRRDRQCRLRSPDAVSAQLGIWYHHEIMPDPLWNQPYPSQRSPVLAKKHCYDIPAARRAGGTGNPAAPAATPSMRRLRRRRSWPSWSRDRRTRADNFAMVWHEGKLYGLNGSGRAQEAVTASSLGIGGRCRRRDGGRLRCLARSRDG